MFSFYGLTTTIYPTIISNGNYGRRNYVEGNDKVCEIAANSFTSLENENRVPEKTNEVMMKSHGEQKEGGEEECAEGSKTCY